MANDGVYILKGYGHLEPVWVNRFFALFRQRQVNIRKLVLLKNGHPECFSMLEVHFVLSLQGEHSAFMELLSEHLLQQAWDEHSLVLMPS